MWRRTETAPPVSLFSLFIEGRTEFISSTWFIPSAAALFPPPKGRGVRGEVARQISSLETSPRRLTRPFRRQRRVMRRQSAKAVALDLQRTIESRAHIFERDSRGQVNDLLRVKLPLHFLEDIVGNVHRRQRHLFCITERGALGGCKQRILGVLRQCGELLFAKSDCAATGSVDIYSKNAADHLRRAQAYHALQGRRCNPRAFDRLLVNRHQEGDTGSIRPRLVRSEHFADAPLHHPGQRLQQPTHLIFFDRFDTHWNTLRLRSPRGDGASLLRLTIEDGTNRD